MNALFALALLGSPSQAGVVMPVESGVAPAGPSAPVVPIGAPAGGLIGAPSFGGLDLRGALPLLPSPVPGLAGPVLGLGFVGNIPEPAAVRPEAAAQVTAAPGLARSSRPADKTPALPAKPAPGSAALAVSRDHEARERTPESALRLERPDGREARSRPLAGSDRLENAAPEKAAGLGRRFFDQSADEDRGALDERAAAQAGGGREESSVIAERAAGESGFGGTNLLAAPNADAAFGTGHGTRRTGLTDASEGEALHDAVASAPGAAMPGGAVSFFRSAAPNGDLRGTGAAAAPSAAVHLVLGAPRPLALDLSRSGLIVRVRSALNGTAPAASVPAPSAAAAPGPSTALLERGAMLEAFSVARAYARTATSEAALGVSRAAAPAAPPSPAAPRAAIPLWWAWFVLPLIVAAVRGIL